jgi:hypothetical protein
MRRIFSAAIFAVPLIIGLVGSAVVVWSAAAEVLIQSVDLRARPTTNARIYGVLAAGATVLVESSHRGWSLVAFDELRGYIPSSALAPLELRENTAMSAENPHCDLGYPYSGSSVYFTGLTELRHSGPLGALLGYHIYRPC